MNRTVERVWGRNDVAYVLASGPSHGLIDLDLLRGRKVVITNNMVFKTPWAPILCVRDKLWWKEYQGRPEFQSFEGEVITVVPNHFHKNLTFLNYGGSDGLSRDRYTVYGLNCGQMAMNVVFLKGAGTIILIGFDMRKVNDLDHGCEPHKRPVKEETYSRFIRNMAVMASELRDEGIEVLNATPGSALPYFPIISMEEALRRGRLN